MTTLPELVVEVGFTAPTTGTALHLDDPARGLLDHGTLGADDIFTDVTQWVQRFQSRRGATRVDSPLLRYEQGTATIVLRNDDRRFDPTNLDGPYVVAGRSQVEPMRAVRIRARVGGVTYPLWRGFSDRWVVGYDGPDSSYVTLTCVDGFAVFASYDRAESAPAGAGEDSGARVSRILDSVAWPADDRMIATGDSVLQATTLAGSALSELQLTADSEMGEFYMDADGRARFRNRLALGEEKRSVRPNARFGDLGDSSGADTTVNLATNPSVELGLDGWLAGGGVGAPSIVQTNTRAKFGAYSLLGTWTGGGFFPSVAYSVTGLTPGRQYTISVYVWVPSGSVRIDTIVGGTGEFGTSSTLFDQWERLTWTGTATTTSWSFQLWPQGAATPGDQVYVDGLQVEEGPVATAYVDGALATVPDPFARTVSGGWGSTPTGEVWTQSGGVSGDYAVASGVATHNLGAVNSSRRTVLAVVDPSDVASTMSVSAVAAGAPIRTALLLRTVDPADEHYRAQLNWMTDGTLSLSLIRRTAAVDTTLDSYDLPFGYSAGTRVRVWAHLDGAELSAKAWLESGTPPTTWLVSAVDSTHPAGPAGCRSLLSTGNTNTLPVVASYDDFAAQLDDPLASWDGPAHASTSRRLPELPYADATLDNATEGLFNLITVGRVGGTPQVVQDAVSRTAYLTRTFSRTDLLLTTDAECLQYATSLLGQSSMPQVRFGSMRLRPAADDRLWPQALGREIGDRLVAVRTPPGGGDPIVRDVWLRGVEHQAADGLSDWTTEWVFQSAAGSTWLVLDNPTSGLLDVNILAY